MLISPLEQFNILSLYDFSPFILTGFDMTPFGGPLFWVYFTIFNPVLSFGLHIPMQTALSGPPLGLFGVVTHFFVTLETAVIGAFLPFIYSISALAHGLVSTSGLTAMATLIDSVPGMFYVPLSFLWSAFRANANLLYSPDHLFFSKVFDLTTCLISEASVGTPDAINTGQERLSPYGTMVESNLSLIYGKIGFLVANLYFLFMELGLSA